MEEQQQQTWFRNGKAEPRARRQIEPISAMIERVAQEHRLRRAAALEAATPALPTEPVSDPLASQPPASPALPVSSVGTGDREEARPASPDLPAPVVGEGDIDPVRRVRCAKGHHFAMLAEHPKIDGTDACPHCMSSTIHEYRKTFAAMVRPPRFE